MQCKVIPIGSEPTDDDRSRYLRLPAHTQMAVSSGKLRDLLSSFHRNAMSAAASRQFLSQLESDLQRWGEEGIKREIYIVDLQEAMEKRGTYWSLIADWLKPTKRMSK